MGQGGAVPCDRTMRDIRFVVFADVLDKTALRGIWVKGLPFE